jgi:phosphatidylglycerophosphate synthase
VLKEEFFATWSALHGGAQISGIVKGWLQISFRIVKVLKKLHVTPNVLTSGGLLTAILLWCYPHGWQAPLFLTLSLIFDGVDGSLAIVTKRTSIAGAMTDSIVDRLSEVFWVLALYKLGAPILALCLVLAFASTQEYLRARAGGLGFVEIGVVTIAERPVRASLIFIILIANNLNLDLIHQLVYLWLVMQVVALLQITFSAHRRMAS